MSEAIKAIPKRTGWKHHPETRAKIKASWTPEQREAARQRGKAHAADREWLLCIAKAVSGERNAMWQGGIAGSKYAPGFSKSLKTRIRERDGHRCQLCGTTEDELGYALSIHHIDYDKSNHEDDNLASVCKRCNSLVNTNRDIWYGYFVALAEVRGEASKDVSHLIGRKVISQRIGFISTRIDGGPDLADLFGDLVP